MRRAAGSTRASASVARAPVRPPRKGFGFLARLRLSYALQVCGIGLAPRVGAVKRILKILTYIAAGLYLLVDAIFMTLAKPIADWIAEHVALRRLRDWIKSLPPYPSLALFSVPVIVLEPIKPIAAYL